MLERSSLRTAGMPRFWRAPERGFQFPSWRAQKSSTPSTLSQRPKQTPATFRLREFKSGSSFGEGAGLRRVVIHKRTLVALTPQILRPALGASKNPKGPKHLRSRVNPPKARRQFAEFLDSCLAEELSRQRSVQFSLAKAGP